MTTQSLRSTDDLFRSDRFGRIFVTLRVIDGTRFGATALPQEIQCRSCEAVGKIRNSNYRKIFATSLKLVFTSDGNPMDIAIP